LYIHQRDIILHIIFDPSIPLAHPLVRSPWCALTHALSLTRSHSCALTLSLLRARTLFQEYGQGLFRGSRSLCPFGRRSVSVLQCVAVCCSVLQCVVVLCCSVGPFGTRYIFCVYACVFFVFRSVCRSVCLSACLL